MNTRHMQLVVIGALGLSLAACARPVTTAPAAAPGAPVASASASASPSAAGGSGASAQVRACANDDLKATITVQPVRDDTTMRGLVAVTNTGDDRCRLKGRASISLTNAAGEVVEVPRTEVNEPGAAVPITLKPGTSAFQGIKWSPCDKGDASCPTGNGLSFNVQASTDGPAADLSGFPAAEKHDITMKALKVGTLQPVTQGVVAW